MRNKIKSIKNFRDLGGIATTDGHHIRHGLLFRSGHLANLEASDADRLRDSMGLRRIIDLRRPSEMSERPDVRVSGVQYLPLSPLNDSQNPCGAHKDRHANIGQGMIGFDTLKKIVHDERFATVPKILETPWLCEEGSDKKTIPPYKEEIALLRKP